MQLGETYTVSGTICKLPADSCGDQDQTQIDGALWYPRARDMGFLTQSIDWLVG